MRKLLVDTCIWIEYFRNRLQDDDKLERGLSQGTVYITGPIIAELLQGVRTAEEREMLRRCIDAVPYAECSLEDWITAGEAAFFLRRQGITIPLTDLIIAVVAKRIGATVYSTDRHFDRIEGVESMASMDS